MGEAYPIGGNSMKWYVGQVRSGHERKIVEKCRTMISRMFYRIALYQSISEKRNIWGAGMM